MYETLTHGRGRFGFDKTVDKRTVRLLGFRFAAALRCGGAVDLPAFTAASAFDGRTWGLTSSEKFDKIHDCTATTTLQFGWVEKNGSNPVRMAL